MLITTDNSSTNFSFLLHCQWMEGNRRRMLAWTRWDTWLRGNHPSWSLGFFGISWWQSHSLCNNDRSITFLISILCVSCACLLFVEDFSMRNCSSWQGLSQRCLCNTNCYDLSLLMHLVSLSLFSYERVESDYALSMWLDYRRYWRARVRQGALFRFCEDSNYQRCDLYVARSCSSETKAPKLIELFNWIHWY